jgi:hypothetical protein
VGALSPLRMVAYERKACALLTNSAAGQLRPDTEVDRGSRNLQEAKASNVCTEKRRRL